jgi:hypothetical protein
VAVLAIVKGRLTLGFPRVPFVQELGQVKGAIDSTGEGSSVPENVGSTLPDATKDRAAIFQLMVIESLGSGREARPTGALPGVSPTQ